MNKIKMQRVRVGAVAILLLHFCTAGNSFFVSCAEEVKVKSDEIRQQQKVSEESVLKDPVGFEAIQQLHKAMDDDHSGTVDLAESSGFVREELRIQEKERLNRRQKTFHHNDDNTITIEDLWHRWMQSQERNWTIDDTVRWLTETVDLPQYTDSFLKNAVDGLALPRLATQNSSFLTNIIGVKNPVHRQKLQLYAMDVVLFGIRQHGNKNLVKDLFLLLLVTLLLFVYVTHRYQKAKAHSELKQLTGHMEKLKGIESEFQEMQTRLNEEKFSKEQHRENSEQVELLRCALEEAEKRLERGSVNNGFAPLALQPLLRKTCETELSSIHQQKIASLKEMREAMDMVEKLRKKQSSMLQSVKVAIGSGTPAQDFDQRIIQIKQKMEMCGRAMEECQERWTQIESLCGFPVLGARSVAVGIYRQPPAVGANAGGMSRGQPMVTPVIQEMDEGSITAQSCVNPKSADLSSLPRVSSLGGGATSISRMLSSQQHLVSSDVSRSMKGSQSTATFALRQTSVPAESTVSSSSSTHDSLRVSGQPPTFNLGENRAVEHETNNNVSINQSSSTVRLRKPLMESIGQTESQDSSSSSSTTNTASSPTDEKIKKKTKSIMGLIGKKDKK